MYVIERWSDSNSGTITVHLFCDSKPERRSVTVDNIMSITRLSGCEVTLRYDVTNSWDTAVKTVNTGCPTTERVVVIVMFIFVRVLLFTPIHRLPAWTPNANTSELTDCLHSTSRSAIVCCSTLTSTPLRPPLSSCLLVFLVLFLLHLLSKLILFKTQWPPLKTKAN